MVSLGAPFGGEPRAIQDVILLSTKMIGEGVLRMLHGLGWLFEVAGGRLVW